MRNIISKPTILSFLFILSLITAGFLAPKKSVYIEGHDNLKYTVEEITASPGEKMIITLKTISDMPASQMAHNWVLLKKEANPQVFINEGLDNKANDYIDPAYEDLIIATTSMLAGGEEETINFDAPSEPGEYVYVCTFPGHYQAGMKGVLIVK